MSDSTVRYVDLSTLGFPGYRIGDDGSLWSRRVKVWTPGVRGCKTVIGSDWSLMKGNEHGDYLRASLSENNTVRRVLIHDLVLMAFVGPCPEGMMALHGNGNGRDNRLENLKWGTAKENAADMMRHGTHYNTSGESSGSAKLTNEDVVFIRNAYENKTHTRAQIAEMFKINKCHVNSIVSRRTWKHI